MGYLKSKMYMFVVLNLNEKIALIIVEHCIKDLLQVVYPWKQKTLHMKVKDGLKTMF